MSEGEETKGEYQKFLEEKHSKFGVEPSVIENAMERAVGAKPAEVKRIIAGEANEVYEAKTEEKNLIIRISRSDEDTFTPEKWAMDKVRELGVPVPTVLLIGEAEDKGKKVNICIEDKLPGRPLSEIYSSLSEEETRKIINQAGEYLAKIHQVVPQGFGRMSEQGIGKHDTWESYMTKPLRPQQVKGLLETVGEIGVSKEDADMVLRILAEHADKYTDVTPHLVHGDYGPKHFLVENGQIVGIIDFENARSGDPMWDFAWWSYFGGHKPSMDWLKEGYEKVTKLPDDFDLRVRLLRLRLGVDMLWYFSQEKNSAGLEIAKKNLQEDLAFFAKSP